MASIDDIVAAINATLSEAELKQIRHGWIVRGRDNGYLRLELAHSIVNALEKIDDQTLEGEAKEFYAWAVFVAEIIQAPMLKFEIAAIPHLVGKDSRKEAAAASRLYLKGLDLMSVFESDPRTLAGSGSVGVTNDETGKYNMLNRAGEVIIQAYQSLWAKVVDAKGE
ncbi:hypothetical protein HYU16_02575 [Candidatus Woesearchaeota archaeon]|nr:hypothetical protein [Candidatus Woesearchaeota archaeon]